MSENNTAIQANNNTKNIHITNNNSQNFTSLENNADKFPNSVADKDSAPAGNTKDAPHGEVTKDHGTESEEKKGRTSFSLAILSKIHSAQMQNGLRHGDYQRYRMYCSRRVRRIRKSLHFLHGKGRFHRKNIDVATVHSVAYLELVLFYAERCWGHAMQLKEEGEENPRAKHHSFRRLVKAGKWAKLLSNLANATADERTKLEAEAYYSWMAGNILVEKEKWQEASVHLIRAKTVYEQLARVGDMEHQELCQQRVEEITPLMKWCAYQLGGKRDDESLKKIADQISVDPTLKVLQTKLERVLEVERTKQAKSLNEIVWRDRRIPIQKERLRLFILNVNEVLSRLESTEDFEKKMKLFDQLLIHITNALRCIKDEINNISVQPIKNEKTQTHKEQLELLQTYFLFMRATKTIHRNLLLIESMEKKRESRIKDAPRADEIVRVYDLVIANAMEMSDLESKDRHQQQCNSHLQADLSSYKAFRCFYLAVSYMENSKYIEASLLFDRCLQHIDTTLRLHVDSKVDDSV
jgi:signal recognition particle subunit SRP68